MLKTTSVRIFAWATMLGIALGAGPMALAADRVDPGFDLFETDPSKTILNIDNQVVHFKGDPIGTLMGQNLGDADTIVQRLTGIDPLPVGGSGMVDLQLRALHLESVAPVTISGTSYNLEVLGGDLLGGPVSPVITNGMTINRTMVDGGTFTANLPVNADLIFRQVGNPSNTFTQSFSDNFKTVSSSSTSTGMVIANTGIWSQTPRFDDPHSDASGPFPAGMFHAGVMPNPRPSMSNCDPPMMPQNPKILTVEEASKAAHGILPAQMMLPPIPPPPSDMLSESITDKLGKPVLSPDMKGVLPPVNLCFPEIGEKAVTFTIPALTVDFKHADGSISDRFHFDAFTVTMTSDPNPGGVPARLGAVKIAAEAFSPITITANSDGDPQINGEFSDQLKILLADGTNLTKLFTEPAGADGADSPIKFPFALLAKQYDLLKEPGSGNLVSDTVDVSPITGYFISSDDPADYDPNTVVNGVVKTEGLNYQLTFKSDVPELDPGSVAGALTLLSGGVLIVTGRRRRQPAA